MKELVSVVVPVYNMEKYLDRCLHSIVTQTYRDLDIILVDDGSTDMSPAMCDRWAWEDPRIRVVHKANEGLGMARNTGIEHARGKYIFFFDSDDYVAENAVEKCVADAEKHDSDVVMYGRYDIYDNVKTVERKVTASKLVFCQEEVREKVLPQLFTYEMGFGVSAWGKMFRVNTIQKNGLRFRSEREIVSEDAYFMLEFLSKASVVTIIPQCLYYYCRRTDSLSRSYRKDRQARNDSFLVQCTQYVEQAGLPTSVIWHIQSRYHGFTLAAMTQIVRCGLSRKEKQEELCKIYDNELLHTTMADEVLKLDGRFPRFFWYCFRSRYYRLCTLLLYGNSYR